MRVLIALPVSHPEIGSLDDALRDQVPLSGTIGSFIRAADLLTRIGIDVTLAVERENDTSKERISLVQHQNVRSNNYEYIIAHQTHWNNGKFSFGNENLPKTILWLQNQTSFREVSDFFSASGNQIVCPSHYHANLYRAARGWSRRASVIPNPLPNCFLKLPFEKVQSRQLIFVGAITPNKGFSEVMQIWSHLSKAGADLNLVVAGGIGLHSGLVATGPLGIADAKFESDKILPWLGKLPSGYKPRFIGSVCPETLKGEIQRSWAGLVNPAKEHPETFCVAAAEIQACGRTVFSVLSGALNETVFRQHFDGLEPTGLAERLASRILVGLRQPEKVAKNGTAAAMFIHEYCCNRTISRSWETLLKSGEAVRSGGALGTRNFLADSLRASGLGNLANTLANQLRRWRSAKLGFYRNPAG